MDIVITLSLQKSPVAKISIMRSELLKVVIFNIENSLSKLTRISSNGYLKFKSVLTKHKSKIVK